MTTLPRNSIPAFGEATQRAIAALLLIAAVTVLPGCGGEAEAKLEDYLLELEFETPLELTREIELGSYVISVAARHQEASRSEARPQWMQLRFRLFAVVDPGDESAVNSEIARQRGLLDDTIMLVCRSASLDELVDNRWGMLKSQIIDRIRPILGQNRLRQLLVLDNYCEPL